MDEATASHTVRAAELDSALAAKDACAAIHIVPNDAQEAEGAIMANIPAEVAAAAAGAEAHEDLQALEAARPEQAAGAAEAAEQAVPRQAAEAEAARRIALVAAATADPQEAEATEQAAVDETAEAEAARLAAVGAAAAREAATQAAAAAEDQERAGAALLELCRNCRCPALAHGVGLEIDGGTCHAAASFSILRPSFVYCILPWHVAVWQSFTCPAPMFSVCSSCQQVMHGIGANYGFG